MLWEQFGAICTSKVPRFEFSLWIALLKNRLDSDGSYSSFASWYDAVPSAINSTVISDVELIFTCTSSRCKSSFFVVFVLAWRWLCVFTVEKRTVNGERRKEDGKSQVESVPD